MWQSACPNAILLAGRSGIFEAIPFDWTRLAERFRGFDGGFSNVFVGDVFGEKHFREFATWRSTFFLDAEK